MVSPAWSPPLLFTASRCASRGNLAPYPASLASRLPGRLAPGQLRLVPSPISASEAAPLSLYPSAHEIASAGPPKKSAQNCLCARPDPPEGVGPGAETVPPYTPHPISSSSHPSTTVAALDPLQGETHDRPSTAESGEGSAGRGPQASNRGRTQGWSQRRSFKRSIAGEGLRVEGGRYLQHPSPNSQHPTPLGPIRRSSPSPRGEAASSVPAGMR